MSKTHELLVEGLLEHGRLRSHQLFARAAARPYFIEQKKSGLPLDKVFLQLVEGRFVERVPIGYKSYHNNDATGETALLAEGRQTRSPVSLVDTPDFKVIVSDANNSTHYV